MASSFGTACSPPSRRVLGFILAGCLCPCREGRGPDSVLHRSFLWRDQNGRPSLDAPQPGSRSYSLRAGQLRPALLIPIHHPSCMQGSEPVYQHLIAPVFSIYSVPMDLTLSLLFELTSTLHWAISTPVLLLSAHLFGATPSPDTIDSGADQALTPRSAVRAARKIYDEIEASRMAARPGGGGEKRDPRLRNRRMILEQAARAEEDRFLASGRKEAADSKLKPAPLMYVRRAVGAPPSSSAASRVAPSALSIPLGWSSVASRTNREVRPDLCPLLTQASASISGPAVSTGPARATASRPLSPPPQPWPGPFPQPSHMASLGPSVATSAQGQIAADLGPSPPFPSYPQSSPISREELSPPQLSLDNVDRAASSSSESTVPPHSPLSTRTTTETPRPSSFSSLFASSSNSQTSSARPSTTLLPPGAFSLLPSRPATPLTLGASSRSDASSSTRLTEDIQSVDWSSLASSPAPFQSSTEFSSALTTLTPAPPGSFHSSSRLPFPVLGTAPPSAPIPLSPSIDSAPTLPLASTTTSPQTKRKATSSPRESRATPTRRAKRATVKSVHSAASGLVPTVKSSTMKTSIVAGTGSDLVDDELKGAAPKSKRRRTDDHGGVFKLQTDSTMSEDVTGDSSGSDLGRQRTARLERAKKFEGNDREGPDASKPLARVGPRRAGGGLEPGVGLGTKRSTASRAGAGIAVTAYSAKAQDLQVEASSASTASQRSSTLGATPSAATSSRRRPSKLGIIPASRAGTSATEASSTSDTVLTAGGPPSVVRSPKRSLKASTAAIRRSASGRATTGSGRGEVRAIAGDGLEAVATAPRFMRAAAAAVKATTSRSSNADDQPPQAQAPVVYSGPRSKGGAEGTRRSGVRGLGSGPSERTKLRRHDDS